MYCYLVLQVWLLSSRNYGKWEENTGESVYLYNITMQFEGYSGEICSDDNYGREVDVTFPSFENSFWKV